MVFSPTYLSPCFLFNPTLKNAWWKCYMGKSIGAVYVTLNPPLTSPSFVSYITFILQHIILKSSSTFVNSGHSKQHRRSTLYMQTSQVGTIKNACIHPHLLPTYWMQMALVTFLTFFTAVTKDLTETTEGRKSFFWFGATAHCGSKVMTAGT